MWHNEKEDFIAKKEPITLTFALVAHPPSRRRCDLAQAADSQGYLGRDNKREDET